MEIGTPEPYFSLTDRIEIVKVVALFGAGQNQFEMIRTPIDPTRIKDVVGKFNIFDSTFVTYEAIEVQDERIKVTPISITSNFKRNQVLFFVSRNITTPRDRLEVRLLDIWRMRAGTARMGNKCFPEEPIRFPFQMPSRGKVFR